MPHQIRIQPAGPAWITDEQLMEQIATGDAIAFGQLYDRFARRAYRVARSVCGCPNAAEDAVQEAFLAIWRSRATYEVRRGGLAAWLLTIVRRKAIDIVRGRSALDQPRAAAGALDAQPDGSDVAEEAVARDDRAAVRGLLSGLPDEQREVISLAFFGELTHTEIAARLRLPVGTVKGRMRLGLTKLRGVAV